MREEFHDKIKIEMKKKEAEIEAKKVELEQVIQKKARMLFR